MQSDTRLYEIRAQILPDIDAATPEAQKALCPGMRDDALRREVFARPALRAFVMDELLPVPQAETGDAPVPDDVLDALTFVLSEDAARVITMVGLIWHGNQLARLISSGAIAIAETGWDIADVRFALGLRAQSKAPDVAEQSFAETVQFSGRACLSAWLNTAPDTIKAALALSDGVLGDAFREAKRSEEKAHVTSVCLNKMRDAQ